MRSQLKLKDLKDGDIVLVESGHFTGGFEFVRFRDIYKDNPRGDYMNCYLHFDMSFPHTVIKVDKPLKVFTDEEFNELLKP